MNKKIRILNIILIIATIVVLSFFVWNKFNIKSVNDMSENNVVEIINIDSICYFIHS